MLTYLLNTTYKAAKGIYEISILKIVRFGEISLKPGKTIITLSKKYKKLALNVAIPTPTKPYLGISKIFRITPTIPDVNLIINSI